MVLASIVDRKSEETVHRAGWVMTDTDTFIRNGFVRTGNGVILETGTFRLSDHTDVIDHGEGLLMPAFVNAHTHLELSALKGRLSFAKGFSSWVRELLKLRESIGIEGLSKDIPEGIEELVRTGALVAGDVSTLGIVAPHVEKSPLSGILFNEYLGSNLPDISDISDSGGFISSFAGHAPHTTSPDLLRFLKKACFKKKLPMSIHLSESKEEFEFITTGKGEWADFLKERGIDFKSWGIPFKSPVSYLDSLGVLDESTLAVHLNFTDKKDLEIIERSGACVCFCLRSNKNLHSTFPDIENMINKKIRFCLGTDSLASTETLSIIDEMRFMADNFRCVSLKDILKAATSGGAEALGLDKSFGSLHKGKQAAMVHIPVQGNNKETLMEELFSDAR